jgi:hypothetical protein
MEYKMSRTYRRRTNIDPSVTRDWILIDGEWIKTEIVDKKERKRLLAVYHSDSYRHLLIRPKHWFCNMHERIFRRKYKRELLNDFENESFTFAYIDKYPLYPWD